MRADIFTKGFVDQAKWSHALSLISHVDARSFWKYDANTAASQIKVKNMDALDAGGLSPAAGEAEGARGSSDVAMPAGGKSSPSLPSALVGSDAAIDRTSYVDSTHVDGDAISLKHGDLLRMSKRNRHRLTHALAAASWPVSNRRYVPGKGTCLGATFDVSGPRLPREQNPY